MTWTWKLSWRKPWPNPPNPRWWPLHLCFVMKIHKRLPVTHIEVTVPCCICHAGEDCRGMKQLCVSAHGVHSLAVRLSSHVLALRAVTFSFLISPQAPRHCIDTLEAEVKRGIKAASDSCTSANCHRVIPLHSCGTVQGKGRLARQAGAADQELGQAEDGDPNERAEMDALLAEQGMPASTDKPKKGML